MADGGTDALPQVTDQLQVILRLDAPVQQVVGDRQRVAGQPAQRADRGAYGVEGVAGDLAERAGHRADRTLQRLLHAGNGVMHRCKRFVHLLLRGVDGGAHQCPGHVRHRRDGGGGHLRRALVDLAEQVRGCIE